MIKSEIVTDIFFDLDHTLWDFERNSAATFRSALSTLDLNLRVDDFMEKYNPINHYYWKFYRENKITTLELRYLRLEKTFEALGVSVTNQMISKLSDAYIDELSTHTHLFEGTQSLLDYLNKNYSLHIITNGFDKVQQKKIRNAGLEAYFKVVLTAEAAGVKKPHPAIFNKAIEMAETKSVQSLMIGDSFEADIEGALKLGMQAIHFNSHDENHHDKCPIVYHLDEIKQYL